MSKKIKVSVFIATSVDGFIAREDGDVAWLDTFESMGEGEDAGYGEIFNAVDALVMGRGSFEKVLTFDWPYGDKPIFVMSRTMNELPTGFKGNVTIMNCSPAELLADMKNRGYTHIYLDGGKLIQSFLREGLVDDMTLTRMPILLGKGIPLFGHLDEDIRLKLIEAKSWINGFISEKYEIIK